MEAIYLHRPDGTKTDVSMCGVCGKVAKGESNFDLSEKCCTCYDCGKPLCEDERRFANRRLYHRACEDARRAKRDAETMEKAIVVEDYGGPVYADGYRGGSYGDGYFADMEEFRESFEERYDVNESPERPEFVFCCTATPVAALDIGQILANHCEDSFEDAEDSLMGVDELSAAFDLFNERNKHVLSYNVDHKRKVRV